MKALRIYYDGAGKVIYNIGLEGTGDFPRTVEEELAKLPPDTKLLELTDNQQISDFLTHISNTVIDGALVLGEPLPKPPAPPIPRNPLSELDAIKQAIKDATSLADLKARIV